MYMYFPFDSFRPRCVTFNWPFKTCITCIGIYCIGLRNIEVISLINALLWLVIHVLQAHIDNTAFDRKYVHKDDKRVAVHTFVICTRILTNILINELSIFFKYIWLYMYKNSTYLGNAIKFTKWYPRPGIKGWQSMWLAMGNIRNHWFKNNK